MSTWADIESDARQAREQAREEMSSLAAPDSTLGRVAYWAEIAEHADAMKWQAVGDSNSDGHPWWTIGLAAGADPEGVRQKYRRRLDS